MHTHLYSYEVITAECLKPIKWTQERLFIHVFQPAKEAHMFWPLWRCFKSFTRKMLCLKIERVYERFSEINKTMTECYANISYIVYLYVLKFLKRFTESCRTVLDERSRAIQEIMKMLKKLSSFLEFPDVSWSCFLILCENHAQQSVCSNKQCSQTRIWKEFQINNLETKK